MVARRAGRIINVSSNAGAFRWPLASAYAVSKAAGSNCTENVRRETKNYGVKVFAIHPGLLPIGMTTARWRGTFPSESPEGSSLIVGPATKSTRDTAPPRSRPWSSVLLLAPGRRTRSLRLLPQPSTMTCGPIMAQAQEVRAQDLYTLQVRRPARIPAERPRAPPKLIETLADRNPS